MIIFKYLCVFLIGGTVYGLIEVVSRGFTHWTMFLAGGICFLFLFGINTRTSFSLPVQCLLGTAVITSVEFITGCIVNLKLNWNVWDYSRHSFNLLGQICPLFTGCWFLLCIPGIWLARTVNAYLFA
ncbi:MAG: hypothetical protein FWF08_09785 [Oscillospiraceae bacterium]|nr:hypothetical protein [Oscillospiraceae bacterium]